MAVVGLNSMKTKRVNLSELLVIVGLIGLVGCLVWPLLSATDQGSNRIGLTRDIIEKCELSEATVVSGLRNGALSSEFKFAFGAKMKQSEGFKQGRIQLSEGAKPVVLDAWKQPLNIMARSNLLALPNVSRALLAKTNAVIIWSNGPDRINDHGNGDDVFLPVSYPQE